MLRFSGLILLSLLFSIGSAHADLPTFEPSQTLLDTQPSPELGHAGDRFGSQLAALGPWLIVGVPEDTVDGVARAGAVYVYRITGHGHGWQLQQRLPNPSPVANAQFGRSVVFDGTRLVVDQAPPTTENTAVMAHVFITSNDGFVPNGVLKLPITTAAGGVGATALALSGDRIAVASGAERKVFFFNANATGWTLDNQALPLEAQAVDGVALALDGNRLMVGIPRVQQIFQLGVVDVYLRDTNGWSARQRLIGAADSTVDLVIGFGADIALSGDRLLVGCGHCTALGDGKRGAAFLFTADASGFWQIQGNPIVDPDGSEEAQFGASVALDGAMAAIAAPLQKNVDGQEAGVIAIYQDIENPMPLRLFPEQLEAGGDGSHYGQGLAVSAGRVVAGLPGFDEVEDSDVALADATVLDIGQIDTFSTIDELFYLPKLHLPNGRRGDDFGAQIAMQSGIAVVGVPGAFVDGIERQGGADVYERIGEQWRFRLRLSATVNTGGAGFGTRLAVQDNVIAIGAPDAVDSRGVRTGFVFLYERDAARWELRQILQPYIATPTQAGPDEGDRIGASIAFDPLTGHLLIGATGVNQNRGRVYEMERGPDGWALSRHFELATGAEEDHFGASLLIDRDRLIVGVPGRDAPPQDNTGALVGFSRAGNSWQQTFIEAPNPATNNQRAGSALANGSNDGPGIYFAGAPYAPDMPRMMRMVEWDTDTRLVYEVGPFQDTRTEDHLGMSMSGAGNGVVAAGSPGPSATNPAGRVKLILSEGINTSYGTLLSSIPRQDGQFGMAVGATSDAFTGATYVFASSARAPSDELNSGMIEVFIGRGGPPPSGTIFRNGFE